MSVSSRASAPLMVRHALRICGLVAAMSAVLGVAHGAETAEVGKALPTGGHTGNAFIATWDDDGDGKVTHAEYEAVRKARFATTDSDHNGSLTVDEYVNEYAVRLDRDIADERTASLKQTDTRFKALDKNEDKFVSRAEYDGSGDRAFVHLDRNKDGRITQRRCRARREKKPSAAGRSSACPRRTASPACSKSTMTTAMTS